MQRLIGPRLALPRRVGLVAGGLLVGAVLAGVAGGFVGDGFLYGLLTVLFAAPVAMLMLVLGSRRLTQVGTVVLVVTMVVSVFAIEAAQPSSTAGLAVLWIPYVCVPTFIVLAVLEVVFVGDRASEADEP